MTSRLAAFLSECSAASYAEPRSCGHDSIIAQVAPIVAELLPKGATVLDVGAGQGPAMLWFYEHDFNPVGVDINDENIRACQALGFHIRKADQNDLSQFGNFDCVWARHVLEHSPIPFFTLKEFHRVLKPGGILYVEMPAPDTNSFHERNGNHYSVFGRRMWEQAITRTGFELLKSADFRFANPMGPDVYFMFIARKRENTVRDIPIPEAALNEVVIGSKDAPGACDETGIKILRHYARQANCIIEIGTAGGKTALNLSDANPKATIVTIDIARDVGKECAGRENVRMIHANSQDFDFESLPADMCFIDGDHTYEGALADSKRILELMPKGRVFWHDYTPIWEGVVRALNELGAVYPIVHFQGSTIAMCERL